MNTEELMRLADAYAFSAQGYNQKGLNEARAALEAALSAKQGEQALQDVSDPAPSVNAQLLELYSLLASAWFYGNWKAETKNERDMQAVMEREGYWPTTEEEILARAAIAAVEGEV